MDPVLISAWFAGVLFLASEAVSKSSMSPNGLGNGDLQRPKHFVHRWELADWLGIAGLVVLCVHIVLAYWITHEGSHRAAVDHVAEETEQVISVRNGSGIYFNFLTVLVWAAYLWIPKPSVYSRVAAIYLWLMFFSAAVVFATPRVAAAFSLLFACCLYVKSRRYWREHQMPS